MNRVALVIAIAACGSKKTEPPKKQDAGVAAVADAGAIVLPPAPPLPEVPAGLPPPPEFPNVTPEAVALGELLFWDTRLSHNNKMSCASCHPPQYGFAGDRQEPNALGKPNLRRASPLVNLAWEKAFGWDGRFMSLAEHLEAHTRGQLGDDLGTALVRIKDVPGYRARIARVADVPSDAVKIALAAYLVTRYQGNAQWDRLERAPDVPAELKAGYLVFTGKAQCSVCHTPPLYTDHQYHRLGLIQTADEGRGRVDAAQKGAFKTPTLRGAASRLGFFHDGSAKSLDDAIDWHLAGGTGHGADPSIIDPALKKVTLTPQERASLGVFVRALTEPTPTPAPALP